MLSLRRANAYIEPARAPAGTLSRCDVVFKNRSGGRPARCGRNMSMHVRYMKYPPCSKGVFVVTANDSDSTSKNHGHLLYYQTWQIVLKFRVRPVIRWLHNTTGVTWRSRCQYLLVRRGRGSGPSCSLLDVPRLAAKVHGVMCSRHFQKGSHQSGAAHGRYVAGICRPNRRSFLFHPSPPLHSSTLRSRPRTKPQILIEPISGKMVCACCAFAATLL